MKTKRLFTLLAAALLAMALAVPAAAQDVWIDETVDESVSTVVGQVIVTDAATGQRETEEVYRGSVSVAYSEPRDRNVESMIYSAQYAAERYAAECGYTVTGECQVTESEPELADNRRYETLDDWDAVLIGDADYLTGAIGEEPNTSDVQTHVASGSYWKKTTYTVTLEARREAPANEIRSAWVTVAVPYGGTTAGVPEAQTPDGYPYSVESAAWIGDDGSETAGFAVVGGETYRLRVTLKAAEGYVFAEGARIKTVRGTVEESSYQRPEGDDTRLTAVIAVTAYTPWSGDYTGFAAGATTGGSYTYVVTGEYGPMPSETMTGGPGTVGSVNFSAGKGNLVELHAVPAAGYRFVGWYEGLEGASYFVEYHTDRLLCPDPTYSFRAEESMALCAVFERIDPLAAVRILQSDVGLRAGAAGTPADAAAILLALCGG